jgi:hypothetical protein
MAIINSGSASTKQPHPSLVIEIAGIARTVPNHAIYPKLGFLIALAVQVTLQDMFSADHDLAWLSCRQTFRGKLCLRVWSDGMAPLIAQDAQPNRAYRRAGKQTPALAHGLEIRGLYLATRNVSDRLGLGGTIHGYDVSVWGHRLHLVQQSRKNRRAAAEQFLEAGQAHGMLCAVSRQTLKKSG